MMPYGSVSTRLEGGFTDVCPLALGRPPPPKKRKGHQGPFLIEIDNGILCVMNWRLYDSRVRPTVNNRRRPGSPGCDSLRHRHRREVRDPGHRRRHHRD